MVAFYFHVFTDTSRQVQIGLKTPPQPPSQHLLKLYEVPGTVITTFVDTILLDFYYTIHETSIFYIYGIQGPGFTYAQGLTAFK